MMILDLEKKKSDRTQTSYTPKGDQPPSRLPSPPNKPPSVDDELAVDLAFFAASVPVGVAAVDEDDVGKGSPTIGARIEPRFSCLF
jgi:hypothetical protein